MGWVWKDDDEDDENGSSLGFRGNGADLDDDDVNPKSDDRCSTRRIVKSKCRTEEIEEGKFIRKCEKTEQVLKDCVGRPTEVVKSTTEYTEDDVTNEIERGSILLESEGVDPFNFPGLRNDIEALEKNVFGGLSRFLDAAEEMRNGLFQVFGTPHHNEDESSPSFRRRIPIEGLERGTPREQKAEDSVYSDFSGQVRDV